MYLRKTTRKNKDGSVVEYLQLAHNVRHPTTRKPQAKIIHNFGRADKLDRDQLIRLCHSLARMCDITIGMPDDTPAAEHEPDDLVLWPADLKLIGSLELGCPWVIDAIWQQLGLKGLFEDLCKKHKQNPLYERAMLAMVANRLCEPESKLGVWDRWIEKVYLPGCSDLKLRHMYEAMDLLHDNIDKVEKHVFFETADLFNLDVDLIFYDTTTASFSIDQADEDINDAVPGIRQFGRCKEGGYSVQVVVALAVTREGIPVRSWVFPGNTTDVNTIEQVKKDLRGWRLTRAMFVADAGMNSEENRGHLARACGKYLLAARMASSAEIRDDVLAQPGRYRKFKDNLEAKEVTIGDGERRRRYILCKNPKEADRQRAHRRDVLDLLEKELASHPDKNATAKWATGLIASRRFGRYLSVTKGGKLRIDRKKVREAERYDGKWVLETNDDTISLEDAACGYKSLMVIERCFRSMKRTQIKMMPVYHRLEPRIISHIKICVLALLVERIAELKCNQPWTNIRRSLEKLKVGQFETKGYGFLRRSEIFPETVNVLKMLKIESPNILLALKKVPGKAKKA